MTPSAIAQAFSNGQFESVYPFLAGDVVWTVVEENTFTGKEAVVKQCEQVGAYFRSVTTDFKPLNVLSDQNKVAITGTAEFIRDNKTISFVSACDVYEFNEKGLVQSITSYCIPRK